MTTFLKRIIRRFPGFRSLDRYLYRRYRNDVAEEPYPRGDFYSPLPDIEKVRSQAGDLFRKDVDAIPGIDLREEHQEALLKELATFYQEFDWPQQQSASRRYYVDNPWFGFGSAFSLYAMLRRFKPKHVIEVGSGYSSAVMLDTSDRFLNGSVEFTFVDPFNERLLSVLRDSDHARCKIVEDVVQNVPVSMFEELELNDFLFVDSSHVSKVGSDVNYIFFSVLPAIQSGVIIHVHDVYWPFEYPESWIVNKRLAWNEAYVLRAFLQYNDGFEIVQFNNFLACRFSGLLEEHMPKFLAAPGGSFWLRKR